MSAKARDQGADAEASRGGPPVNEPMTVEEAWSISLAAGTRLSAGAHAVAREQHRRDQAEIERLRTVLADACDALEGEAEFAGIAGLHATRENMLRQVGELRARGGIETGKPAELRNG